MAKKSKRINSVTIRENAKRDNSPKWTGCEKWTAEQFSRNFHDAMNYYNLNHTGKDLKPKIIDWMGRNGYPKKTIAAFKATNDGMCGPTMGAIAACLINGMPTKHKLFNGGRDTVEWLKNKITETINTVPAEEKVEAKKDKAAAPVITVQDRIRDQAIEMSNDLDRAIDQYLTNPAKFDPKSVNILSMFRTKNAKAPHARYIKSFFAAGQEELQVLASGKADDQLREAWSHHPRKNVKKLIEFYGMIMTACDQVAAEAKVLKKPRKKKVKPAEEQVKKIKFKTSDDQLNIVSTPPAQMIGAMGVIVYNVRTRKLGYYIAKTSEGLGVKGAGLMNFTEKSVQKTLRKPDVSLKELKEQNTQKRFETWFEKSVKTTDTKLNGRLNEDTIILKVWK